MTPPTVPPKICPPFAAALRSGRDRFNAQFAQARRQHPALDGEAFSEFLVACVDPLVAAVADTRPDAVQEVVTTAYEIALELVGQGLAGPRAREPFITAAWQELFPIATPLVAAAPGRVIGAVCNALHQLGGTPGARPRQWLTETVRLAPHAQADAELFLKLGQVVAWRAGLAHFRAGALAVADTLPESLALLAVGAPAGASWPAVREALRGDPWFAPERDADGGLRVAGRAGAFRGFGGLFTRPPTVASDGENFFVRSGDGCWLLTADAFGATFHRAEAAEFDRAARHPGTPPDSRIDPDGGFTLHRKKISLPICGSITATAATGDTLALTSAHSHAILFVALRDRH